MSATDHYLDAVERWLDHLDAALDAGDVETVAELAAPTPPDEPATATAAQRRRAAALERRRAAVASHARRLRDDASAQLSTARAARAAGRAYITQERRSR